MSQTETKSKQSNTTASGGGKAGSGGSQPARGSQGLVYLVVFVLLIVVVAAFFMGKGDNEPRPVASAATEEEPAVEPEAATETEADAVALVIDSNVRGADVFLNGNRVGKTPHKATPLVPGDYDVRVEHDGYETFEDSVRVETAEDSIHATLRPMSSESSTRDEDRAARLPVEEEAEETDSAPADIRGGVDRVAVEHNHRIGSCEGVLVASADGVHFETEHKDAFFAAYADIEELSFDQDELTLKVLNGRKYDFTEPNDDAEALAAFHRQAARKVESAKP